MKDRGYLILNPNCSTGLPDPWTKDRNAAAVKADLDTGITRRESNVGKMVWSNTIKDFEYARLYSAVPLKIFLVCKRKKLRILEKNIMYLLNQT